MEAVHVEKWKLQLESEVTIVGVSRTLFMKVRTGIL